MCIPLSIALAGVSIASQQVAAGKANKAARKNAEDMIAQSSGAQSAALVKRAIDAGNTAREAFSRTLSKEETMASTNVAYGNLIGTPRSDTERAFQISAMDAEYAMMEASKIRVMQTKDEMSSIFLRTRAGIASLPTVSVGEQVTGVVETGVKSWAFYEQQEALKPPSNA